MALAANDVLHKFYWVRIPAVHGVCLDPMQCLAKPPKVDPMEYLSGRFVLQRVDEIFGTKLWGLSSRLLAGEIICRWCPCTMAPKKTRTDATIKRLLWTSVFGGLRATYEGSGFRVAYADLARCLRGCTIIQHKIWW